MDTLVTTDTILDWLKEQVEHKKQVSPHLYVDACTKLNILIGDEHDKLFDLQQKVAQERIKWIELDKSAAEAKMRVEADEIYRQYKKQEARIAQIEEAIRIAKIRAKLKDTEFGNY